MNMDRFLCRVKQLSDNKWVKGYVWISEAATRPSLCITDDWGEFFDIDPNTLGQCTGQRDMEGNLIFEGDIVRFEGCSEIEAGGLVLWEDDTAKFYIKNIVGKQKTDLYSYLLITVIGNIHDNPELF